MLPDIYIRVDGNSSTGLGHIYRSFSLALMLKDNFYVSFFCKKIPNLLQNEIKQVGFNVNLLESDDEFLEFLKPGLIVVFDGYHFDKDIQARVRDLGCRIACIDDVYDHPYDADLIINHSPGIFAHKYDAPPYTFYALGPEYALLRPSFLAQAQNGREIRSLDSVFLCFGGSDPKELTYHTLLNLLELKSTNKINVVTGPGYKFNEHFLKLLHADDRIKHYHALNSDELVNVMINSDIAIVPSSSILFEAIACGCIIITGYYVSNQKIIYEFLTENKFVYDAFDFSKSNILSALNELYNDFNNGTLKIPKLVDGESPKRILKLFNELLLDTQIFVRRASADDSKLTYKWASNPNIRKYALNQHEITWDEHFNWFNNKIKQNNCFYYIGEISNKPFGSIRFDIKNDEAYFSLIVDPEFQGKGLGMLLYKKGVEQLLIDTRGNKREFSIISGHVMVENLPAIRAYDRLGFVKILDSNNLYKIYKPLN